jgi:hypothetical protein
VNVHVREGTFTRRVTALMEPGGSRLLDGARASGQHGEVTASPVSHRPDQKSSACSAA